MGKRVRAFYIALASLIGFDVRFNRRGEVRFHLRDKRQEKKKLRRAMERRKRMELS